MHKNNIQNQPNITINELAVRIDKNLILTSDLATEMRKGFDKLDKKIDDSVGELARSVASGFKEVDVRFTEMRDEIATKATTESIEHLEDKLANRVDILENLIVKDHGTRLRRIERKLQFA